MNRTAIINASAVFAVLSLAVGLAVAVLAFAGAISFDDYKLVFNLTSIAWFIFSPLWLVPRMFGEKWKAAGEKAWFKMGK